MTQVKRNIRELDNLTPATLPGDILTGSEPVVLRGLVSDWPVVKAAKV